MDDQSSAMTTVAVASQVRAPQGADTARLRRGVLGTFDVLSSTLANIAPALGFYFSFAAIATFAGVGSPLVIIAAAVAIALVGNTLAQFARYRPSAGSFVTFIAAGLGPYTALAAALVLVIGYIVAFGAIVGIAGGWGHLVIQKYLHADIPWQVLSAVATLATLWLMIRGVSLSTRWAAAFFGMELLLLLVVSIGLLIDASHISLRPFDPSSLASLKGFGLAFPLAVYMFVGWENSAAMSEETRDPRRSVARAVFTSTLLMGIAYTLLTFATLVSFGDSVKAATTPAVPFVTAAQSVLGVFAFLAYLAGVTSILGCLIGAANSQARILFNIAREGMVPRWIGAVHERHGTPARSLSIYCLLTLAIVYVFGWSTNPFTFFAEIATLGTIPISFIYLVTNLALPAYSIRGGLRANPLTHIVLPILGVLAIGYPLYELVKPGQPSPYNEYPWISLALVVFGLVYAAVLYRRNPRLGESIGSIMAE
ncbi:MAG TPA: APC family permease [Solirubrobacteraceae bacterium]|nr:APC family permease [Solirubrobacteraceae bacterium]